MMNTKDILIRAIQNRATQRLGELSRQMVRLQPSDREDVLAELEFQRWLSETCSDCLIGS